MENKNMLLVFSHKLTDEQIKDAKENLNIKKFISLPENLQNIWSNIPPERVNIDKELEKIKKWIKENSNSRDYVLVQGDFGSTYKIVEYCKKNQFDNNIFYYQENCSRK